MDKGNKISVRINGEDTYLDREAQKEVQKAQDEQASAIEDWMEEQEKQKRQASQQEDSDSSDLSVLERTYPVKKSRFGIPKTIKKLVMAGVAAVFIGMALGYIMLRLFAGMEAPEATSTPAYQEDIDNQPAPTSENKGQEEAASDTKDNTTNSGEKGQAVAATKNTVTFPAMSAFVVQAGIFSTKEKAEIMQRSISQKGVETFVWPRDGQFYLFAGVAPSKAEGEQIATMLKANGIEVYVKEWSVAGAEKEVAKAEGEWVQNGIDGWKSLIGPASALVATSAGDVTAMNNSLPSAPDTISEQATPFQQSVERYTSALQTYEAEQSEATSWEIQVSLLDMWHGYERYVQ